MDLNNVIQHVKGVSCIVSVSKNAGLAGNIVAIEAANKAYLASVDKLDEEFVPGRPYSYYIQADPNFEAFVKRCVSSGSIQHQYVNAGLYNAWLDLYLIPLESDEEKGYCLFTYEMNTRAEADKLLDVSQTTALEVLRTCIKLRETNDFQKAMDSIIKDIRKMCESSGCSILLTDFENKTCKVLCVDDDGSFSVNKEDIIFTQQFYAIAETWRDLMAGSNCYIIADENDMKVVEEKNPKWAGSMKTSGIYNVVLYPLRLNNRILGYIWAANFNRKKIRIIKEVMEINAFLLSTEIANHQMFDKLNIMSRYDMLTGVLNRNAMNNRIEESRNGTKPFNDDYGIVFVDVNGLKRTNDEKGHTAGDELIKSVADKVREIFEECEIYRAGGDEFMVIAENCTKNKFEYLVDKLKEQDINSEDPKFAVGSFYDEGAHDIKNALREADSDMYADKSEFYRKHPELSRRSG